MRAPRLSPRLQAAADLLGHTASMADVGCDHGKLSVYALVEGLSPRVVAVDVSAPSLAKAERLAADYGVPLECRVGDGLAPTARDRVETVVIAGMGGMETVRCLALAPYAPRRLVLVPHHNVEAVRGYLHLAGYRVEHDYVVEDAGHWYHAISAEGNEAHPLGDGWQDAIARLSPECNWYVGEDDRRTPAYAAYRAARLAKLLEIVAKGNRDPKVAAEIEYLQKIEYEG